MAQDATAHEIPTRRDFVKGGGTIVGGGLLAGCAGDKTPESTPTETAEATEANTSSEDESYTVRMAPVGEVTFDAVPETAYAYSPHYADMAVAFGHGDAIASLGAPDAYAMSMNYYYDAIDGASIERDDLRAVWSDGVDKELFYDIGADVHFQDPCWLRSFAANWDHGDIEEIRETVGPWFGNRYSREHTQPPECCRDGYRYYTLWELSERVAAVFRESRRYEAFRAEYESLYGRIRANLPPESERPTVGLVVFSDETFRPYKLNNPGFAKAHIRPFGVQDAFADSDQTYDQNENGRIDYEGMLAAAPDVILHSQGISGFFDVAAIRETLENDPVGSELSAVQNDRVYSSGTPFQGPLMNLFQLEMTAKQLYPEIFGEWPADGSEDTYPEIPSSERLFDRQRVTESIQGDFDA